MKSVLTKNQKQTYTKKINYDGVKCTMIVTLRYDDECGNGHNTFSITGSIKENKITCYNSKMWLCGCIHGDIVQYFPEFKHLIKWHLCNSQEPLYYYQNTSYFMRLGNIELAKKCAIWGVTPLDTDVNKLTSKKFLAQRLPFVMKAFKKDIEALGFIF